MGGVGASLDNGRIVGGQRYEVLQASFLKYSTVLRIYYTFGQRCSKAAGTIWADYTVKDEVLSLYGIYLSGSKVH